MTTRKVFGVALAAAALAVSTRLVAQSDEEQRVRESMTIVREIMSTADRAIPASVLARAEGIAVFPASRKAGPGVDGHRAAGILSARVPGTRGWSAPAFLTITRGSGGEQTGTHVDDIVLVIVNRRSLESVVNKDFTMSAGFGVAPGPIGRDAASTDVQMQAGIFTYSRSGGALAPVSLNGELVRADPDGNRHFYGRALRTADVVFRGKAGGTELVRDWEQLLARVRAVDHIGGDKDGQRANGRIVAERSSAVVLSKALAADTSARGRRMTYRKSETFLFGYAGVGRAPTASGVYTIFSARR